MCATSVQQASTRMTSAHWIALASIQATATCRAGEANDQGAQSWSDDTASDGITPQVVAQWAAVAPYGVDSAVRTMRPVVQAPEQEDAMEHHELALPAQLSAVGLARHWMTGRCASHVDEDTVHVVQLLTSELVTNAVVHGREPLRLELDRRPDCVHIGVVDASPEPPVLRDAEWDDTGGRGIALVDLLAATWGYEPQSDGPGKTVWFECPATHIDG
ncbi:ATP-binding protein [Kineococcus rhizosphaerae]|nr:ATP-binding protein [Kineococcus rhizosphaerae]